LFASQVPYKQQDLTGLNLKTKSVSPSMPQIYPKCWC